MRTTNLSVQTITCTTPDSQPEHHGDSNSSGCSANFVTGTVTANIII